MRVDDALIGELAAADPHRAQEPGHRDASRPLDVVVVAADLVPVLREQRHEVARRGFGPVLTEMPPDNRCGLPGGPHGIAGTVRSPMRHDEGASPTHRLKARLNAASEP